MRRSGAGGLDQLAGRVDLRLLGGSVAESAGPQRPVGPGGQPDRGQSDHRWAESWLIGLGLKRRADLRQRLSVSPCHRACSASSPREVYRRTGGRPGRLEPAAALGVGRVAPGHVDEQRHRRQLGLGVVVTRTLNPSAISWA